MPYNVKESDWKLFRKLVPGWQERYMEKLNKEYVEILSRKENPSTNLWDLKKRIDQDKKSIGVVINMKRSMMWENLVLMLQEKVIDKSDLIDFSDELQDSLSEFY